MLNADPRNAVAPPIRPPLCRYSSVSTVKTTLILCLIFSTRRITDCASCPCAAAREAAIASHHAQSQRNRFRVNDMGWNFWKLFFCHLDGLNCRAHMVRNHDCDNFIHFIRQLGIQFDKISSRELRSSGPFITGLHHTIKFRCFQICTCLIGFINEVHVNRGYIDSKFFPLSGIREQAPSVTIAIFCFFILFLLYRMVVSTLLSRK